MTRFDRIELATYLNKALNLKEALNSSSVEPNHVNFKNRLKTNLNKLKNSKFVWHIFLQIFDSI